MSEPLLEQEGAPSKSAWQSFVDYLPFGGSSSGADASRRQSMSSQDLQKSVNQMRDNLEQVKEQIVMAEKANERLQRRSQQAEEASVLSTGSPEVQPLSTKEYDTEIQSLQREVDALEGEIADKESRTNQMEAELKSLSSASGDSAATLQKLQNTLQQVQSEWEQLERERAQKGNSLQEEEKKVADLEEQLRKLEADTNAISKEAGGSPTAGRRTSSNLADRMAAFNRT